jgi:hypothetical protein
LRTTLPLLHECFYWAKKAHFAAVPTDSYLTLDVGFGSGQLVLRMNAKSPFPPNGRSDNSGSGIISEIVESLVRRVRLDNAQ